MLKLKKTIGFLFLIIATDAFSVDPTHDWKTIETDNFYIHFSEDNIKLANKAAVAAEKAHKKLAEKLDWQPEEKTHLAISDETDSPNGYAITFPINRSVLFVAPPDTTNTLEDYDDWLDTLITHEYTHILHLDKVSGGARILRKLFGRHWLLFPNAFQPNWFVEGLATYYETDLENGIGRGQSSLFQMMMRMEVASGVKPVSQVNLPMRSWPMGTAHYLYGVYFYQFIEERYGKTAIVALVDNYSRNIVPFMINTNARRVLGKDIDQLWDEFTGWLENRFQTQLVVIEQQGVIAGKAITSDGYFTGPVQVSADGDVYYLRQGAFNYPALMTIDSSGNHKEIAELHAGARFDVHAEQGVLIAQPEYCDEYNFYYDLFILKPDSDKPEAITSCGRYRSAAWSPDGKQIIAVHTEKAISQLQILNNRGEQQSVIWQGADNEVIGQPDWSVDGRFIVASVFRPGKGWNIEQFDLNTNRWEMITDDAFIDVQPQYSNDGASIVFSSERTGIYNIYKTDLYNKITTQLTRVKSGAFNPSMKNKDVLYYIGYDGNGTDVMALVNAEDSVTDIITQQQVVTPVTKVNKEPVSLEKNYPSENYSPRDYSPWSSLEPRWWEPLLFAGEEQYEVGLSTSGNDALGIHNYFLQAAVDVKNEWLVGSFSYSYSNRLFAGVRRTTSIISDTGGAFAYAIKEDNIFASLAFPYTKDKYRWNFITGLFVSEDSERRRAPGIPPLANFKDNIFGLAATFNNSEQYIRSISENDGRAVNAIAESSDIISSDFSGEIYTLDWREYIPLGGQNVLAIRLTEGYGTDNPNPFKLGGEDSNLDLLTILNPGGEPLFGHRKYALRGYAEGLPQLRGRRMQLASLEWRFPLALVERGYMSPPVGLNQLSGSFFLDTGATWQDGHSPDKYFTGVGAELHADVNLFYGLNLRMRLGLASGLDDVVGDNRAYISLGSSF